MIDTRVRLGLLALILLAPAGPAAAHREVDSSVKALVGPGLARAQLVPDGDPALVEEGRRLFLTETFGGNGRTCATCHRPERGFSIDPAFIQGLPPSDPLFVAERDPALGGLESPALMRRHGLILGNLDGFNRPAVARSVPHLLGLRLSGGAPSEAPSQGVLGWSGDGAPGDGSLAQFALGAVVQHFPRRLARRPNVDYRVPSAAELAALAAFQLSLGRQERMRLDPADPQALRFPDPDVSEGQRLFHGAPDRRGGTRRCAACHENAGAAPPGGEGINVDIGTQLSPAAPACRDRRLPGDGGQGVRPVRKLALCGRKVTFRGNGRFNAPSLIEAAATPPYFHNNAAETIEEAVAFYASATFNASPAGGGHGFRLKRAQVRQIAAFLRAVSALDRLAAAARALDASAGEAQAAREIDDALAVLTGGPLRPFAATGALEALAAARERAAAGDPSAASVELERARAAMLVPSAE